MRKCIFYIFMVTFWMKAIPVVPIPENTTYEKWIFEEVHYDDLRPRIKNEQYDCYAHFISCILSKNLNNPVCGYRIVLWFGYYDSYPNLCALEFDNCFYRIYDGNGVYGYSYEDNWIEWNGEDWDCSRMLRTIDGVEEKMKALGPPLEPQTSFTGLVPMPDADPAYTK